MSNPFFTWSFDVTPGNTARSRPVENEFAAIGTGFAGVWAYIQRGLFAPTGETLDKTSQPQARVTRAIRLVSRVFMVENSGKTGVNKCQTI